jgi:curved DNA-binding protein CbpA
MSLYEALEVLGLRRNASRDEVIRAHRRKISRFHPDRGGNHDTAALINLARDVLLANLAEEANLRTK